MISIRSTASAFLLTFPLWFIPTALNAADSTDGVKISKAVLVRLVGDQFEPVESFVPTDNFGVLVFLSEGKAGTRVKANWIALDAGGMKDKSIFEKEVVVTPEAINATADATRIDFSLTHDNPYPVGSFKTDLYVNDVLTKTVEFNIESLTYTLDFCGTKKTENPSKADLQASVAALDTNKNDAFLSVATTDMTYLQVSGDGKAGFVLEYQEGDLQHHFQAGRTDLTADEVVKALTSYIAGTEEWKKALEWSKVEL